MAARTKTLMGMTVAVLLVAGAAWASGEPVETNSVERTVIPVDPAGEVTLEVIPAGLSIATVVPNTGWTVTVENSVGPEVEARLVSDEGWVDFKAELEDGEIRVDIERRLEEASSTTTLVTTPSTSSTSSTSTSSPSSTAPSTTATTLEDDGTTSTTVDDDAVDIPDGTRTFEAGAAGSITVDIRSGTLSLVSGNARSGWSHEVDKARSDDIEGEFSNGDAEAEIRVRIHDGRLEVRVDAD